jgi:metal iron transporter
MNYPSRSDDTEGHPDWNQNPQELNADATTRADLDGIVNLRAQQEHRLDLDRRDDDRIDPNLNCSEPPSIQQGIAKSKESISSQSVAATPRSNHSTRTYLRQARDVLVKYAQFVGPGFLIAVAYIDPGNYATDVEAGASTRYRHLFIILMSNLFAIFLQSLCIKLGSVTGLDLAQNCRKYLPRWLNYALYGLAETAIIATDMAEVIGSAIALNLLFHIPLAAGCAITIVDVLFLMLFWSPDGSMRRLRLFEFFVVGLVLSVMICFCIQLSYIHDASASEVFQGYLPSSAIVEGNGIYLSCGILGATVMPHSLFLGSGIVQPRLRQFDDANGLLDTSRGPYETETNTSRQIPGETLDKYRPTLTAIRSCLKYSIAELATSLFTFALFVNSAILIVAGSALYPSTEATQADLFGIHALLTSSVSKVAGTLFALALLLSGTSAGIVCTMAGQMVSEGMLQWRCKPWVRRLVTRSISIVPSIVIAASVGKEGLNQALTASQVVLSVILPFVSAPLVWFTCRATIMSVEADALGRRSEGEFGAVERVNMRNGWVVTGFAIVIWLVLVVMNLALLVLVGLGKA